ncbi:MAG: low molecular weight phosphatase family protein [Candidatus Aenigmatarchaeota archaeon]|nr:MAG: low molecular weight phosphatase family protein [Candidatus Aenigmarchaeota archaeon]
MLVLFVCGANVGRSQVAEAYFNHYARRHKAVSAAAQFKGDTKISPTFKLMLEKEGVATAGQKPKPLTPDMVEEADRIIVLCSRTECPVYLLKSNKADFWSVRDVGAAGTEDRERVAAEIKENVMRLIEELGD